MARTVRIVLYAVNGGGVGHLTRLVAIARWLRRYAAHAGVRPEILFLSSSEADSLLHAERFASFKLPSKTVVSEAGLDKLAYLALAKQWVWQSVALLRPDLFVVDSFPRGSFGELGGCIDLCRKRAFIYRPMKREFAAQPDFQSILPFYDLVVVPEREVELPVPPEVRPRLRRVGPIAVRERVELPTRAEARRTLGVSDEAFVVHASAGGGGDPGAEADLAGIVEAFAGDPNTELVVAAGPLYRGRLRMGPNIRWLGASGAVELLPAADVAVVGAGYNTVAELATAGVPAVFVPQEKVADEQAARAQRFVDAGAAVSIQRPLHAAAVRLAVEPFRDAETRRRMADAARSLGDDNGARDAAKALLSLVLPLSVVDAAARAVDDAVLESAHRTGHPEQLYVDVMQLLDPASDELPGMEPERASREAVALVESLAERGTRVAEALRVCNALLRRADHASALERARACDVVLRAFAPFDDLAGVAALLKVAPLDASLRIEDQASSLASFATALRDEGVGLYDGIGRLVRGERRLGLVRAADQLDEGADPADDEVPEARAP
jgi:UDP-N-acetylglucosamine--N-acetylmuramyl-(pentapeptide) pyrophosphoryl-undecaprenol N-acetylglucosamine transferase